jgi:hypothetical protein
MTAKEAYKVFSKKFDKLVALTCYEYESRFVFNAVPKKYEHSKESAAMLDSSYFVEKSTGAIGKFKPFLIPLVEYKAGKQIKDFK